MLSTWQVSENLLQENGVFLKKLKHASIYITSLVFIGSKPVQTTNKQTKGVNRQVSYPVKTIKTGWRPWTLDIATYNSKPSTYQLGHDSLSSSATFYSFGFGFHQLLVIRTRAIPTQLATPDKRSRLCRLWVGVSTASVALACAGTLCKKANFMYDVFTIIEFIESNVTKVLLKRFLITPESWITYLKLT